MNNTAPIGTGILTIAAVFGLIGGAVSYVAYGFGFFGALMIAILIAVVVAIVLWLGWRKPNQPAGSGDTAVARTAGAAPTAPASSAAGRAAATATSASAPSATTTAGTSGGVSSAAAGSASGGTAGGAAATSAAGASAATAKVTPSAPLAGEQELADRKGDWKYDKSADAAPAAAASADTAPAAAASVGTAAAATPAPASGGTADYDGDGVLEGKDEGSKPVTLTAARDGGPDDLKQIKGVGPKMEGMLHGMGFFHFDQIAAWTASEVAWVDANLEGFKGRVSRDNWVSQAKTLAAGGETEFSKKVEKGGVY